MNTVVANERKKGLCVVSLYRVLFESVANSTEEKPFTCHSVTCFIFCSLLFSSLLFIFIFLLRFVAFQPKLVLEWRRKSHRNSISYGQMCKELAWKRLAQRQLQCGSIIKDFFYSLFFYFIWFVVVIVVFNSFGALFFISVEFVGDGFFFTAFIAVVLNGRLVARSVGYRMMNRMHRLGTISIIFCCCLHPFSFFFFSVRVFVSFSSLLRSRFASLPLYFTFTMRYLCQRKQTPKTSMDDAMVAPYFSTNWAMY